MDDSSIGVQAEPHPDPAPTDRFGDTPTAHEQIGVGSGDENMARIQLAARWAESYTPAQGDSLEGVLRRFRRAYAFIDSVTHGVEPDDL